MASLGSNLIRTVTSNQLGEAVFDLAEIALDRNLAEGVLKDVPLVGTLVKLVRARQVISEELFIRKLERFLTGLDTIAIEDREKLLEKYPDSSDEQKYLGENLLLALERLDDVKKPAILARFFAAYIKSEIDYLTFTRLARALENFNLELLPSLKQFYLHTESDVQIPEEITHELSLAGLVVVSMVGPEGTFAGVGAHYQHSELAKCFLHIGFDAEL
ncbi:MAG: hypothetical protein PHI11_09260 [Gallionella sp.]|nr:hypothetical protein [Gallionella sp.]